MILVTGTPRSGSSAVMQTLSLLGVPIAGSDLVDMTGVSHLTPYDSEFKDELLKYNPKGFWTLPDEGMLSFLRDENLRGQALKLLAPSHSNILTTHVSKAIVCCRESKKDQEESLQRLLYEEYGILPEGYRRLYIQYLFSIDLTKWLEYYQGEVDYFLKNLEIPTVKIFFEDLISSPTRSINKIRKFLGLQCDIENAVRNID